MGDAQERGGLMSDFLLTDLLKDVDQIIGEPARAKGLAFSLDADSVPLYLRGDRTRLRQALLNYAGNALKFTDKGSIVVRKAYSGSADGSTSATPKTARTASGWPASTHSNG